MGDGMFCNIATVFNRIVDGDDCMYNPTIITGCFICKTSKVVDTDKGVTPSSIGKCVIPYTAVSSHEFAPKYEYDKMTPEDQHNYWTLRDGDFIVSGSIMDDGLTANDIQLLDGCFQIKSVFDNDFASIKTRMVTGL